MNPITSTAVRLSGRRASRAYRAAHTADRPHWLGGERLRTYALAALACYGMFLAVYLYRTGWQHRPGLRAAGTGLSAFLECVVAGIASPCARCVQPRCADRSGD